MSTMSYSARTYEYLHSLEYLKKQRQLPEWAER